MSLCRIYEIHTLRARLVHCSADYNVIGIRITRNEESRDEIIIPIHQFSDNT